MEKNPLLPHTQRMAKIWRMKAAGRKETYKYVYNRNF